jgi:hypothetical protein
MPLQAGELVTGQPARLILDLKRREGIILTRHDEHASDDEQS